jgi:ElaB/YqjD/DUF883 family membrane-anchored ribosome-binding protein
MIWRDNELHGTSEPGDQPAPSAAPAPQAPPAPANGSLAAGPGPSGPDASVGSRIQSLIEAAEQAAAGIREEAEEAARTYLEESRRRADALASERVQEISQLTDNLVSRARAVARQSDELIAALDEAGRRVLGTKPAQTSPPEPPVQSPPGPAQTVPFPAEAAASRPEPPQAAESRPEPPSAPAAPIAAPFPSASSAAESVPVSEGARRLATQMAVAKCSRDEISRRLREEFGIQDSTAILNEIGI